MSDQYRVDLSELEGTITKLNGVIKDLGRANSTVQNDTYLPPGALGSGFDEAKQLTQSHDEMKLHIEEIVQHIHDVMNQFGKNTKTAHGAYQNSEYETQSGMSGQAKS